ncbi:HNH endonuclease signature motif containing protein [Mycobacteroides abscessus]|uniref:HNH endonuclease signature motif containing protein n=1 Tax=Mycobacteroides abscessus TaxID=36809 RepID=UPI0009A5CAFC
MPWMAARPCLGCGDLIDKGSRCTACRPKDTRRNRGPGRSQGDWQWRQLSKRLRTQSPFCEFCGSKDGLTVDHIIPPSEAPKLAHEVVNLRVLCRSCNSRRGNRVTDIERIAVYRAIEERKHRAKVILWETQ